MKNKLLATMSVLMIITASIIPMIHLSKAVEVTLTLSDAELSTQFAKAWGPAALTAITDIPGIGVRFNFTGLTGSGTGLKDNFPVSALAGGSSDSIGGWGNFRAYTQYRLVFTNLGPNATSVNIFINTGWTAGAGRNGTWDTYWENGWVGIGAGQSQIVTLDFSSAICYNAQDDPDLAWRYPGGTSGVIVRRLDEVSAIGFQVCGSGAGAIVVSATTPTDVALALSDTELSTQFAKETGPGTVTITDIPGLGVRFDFTGLSSSTGTVVGDNFPVSSLAGGAYKNYGGGFAGPYDFSGFAKYSLVFTNVGTTAIKVNLKMNTGWTNSPWGTPSRDTFWQNGWTHLPPGESRVVTLDFWSAQVYNAGDDPVPEWRYSDGTSGVIVRRLDEVSDIGFQVLGGSDASVIVIGQTILTLSDAEMSTQFAKETGPGTLTAITDIPGPGVRFDFTGLSGSTGTVVGDNFPVSSLAGGAYKTYGVNQTFSTWGDFFSYTLFKMICTNVGPNPVTVNLKVNTGWTVPPPEYAAMWRDTFWQDTWTYIAPGESTVITLDFASAEVYNAADEQEYGARADGTTGVAVWRLEEVSDIGFQILADGSASVILSARPQPPIVYVDDDYDSSTPGWGYDHFDSIQDGVDAVLDGGTVYVYDGTYNEKVTITKDNLRVLAASSPTLDGTGIGTSGFIVMADYVEISGFIIRNFTSTIMGVGGIELRGANHCWIHDNEIRWNNHGIVFGDSTFASYPSNDYNTIEHNTIHHNNNPAAAWYFAGFGVYCRYGNSSHNTIYENNIYSHDHNGILVCQHERYNPYALGYGGHTGWNITKNTLDYNGWYGIEITNGLNSVIEQNTINHTGINGIAIQAWDYAEVYNINVTSNIIQGSGYYGIYVGAAQDAYTPISSTVHHVRITSNDVHNNVYQGIVTYSTSVPSGIHHLTIEDNEVYYHLFMGMLFYDLIDSKISYNEIYGNLYHGIYMFDRSGDNEISYNKIHNNLYHGIKVNTGGHVIRYNELYNNGQDGIFVDSDGNIIEYNTITGNVGAFSGVHLTATADGNEIHYNSIEGNTGTNVYGVYKEGGSTVNATYNWWGDQSGPYHSTLNPTGSGDMVSDYVDFIPWLQIEYDVAVIDVTASPTTVAAGETVTIQVTVENQGSDYENFTVTAYYDNTAIGSQDVTNLLPNWNTTLTFYWYTTGMPRGNYTIKANASILLGEIDVLDNELQDGIVEILWHDVAITDVVANCTWVYQTHFASIDVTVVNQGDYPETATVTLYYNITANKVIGVVAVDLQPGEDTTITYIWNTTEVEYCHNYTMTANTTIIPLECDPGDNTFDDGKIKVRILGDTNGDGTVNMQDIYALIINFLVDEQDQRWNPDLDLIQDGIINMLDIYWAVIHFLDTCP